MAPDSPRKGIDLLMTTGPVEVSPRVLAALAQPVTYHYYPKFLDFYDATSQKLAQVYSLGRKEDVLILQGEAVLGMEASIACTVNSGDKVIVLDNGPFGSAFAQYIKNAGGVPVYFQAENDRALDGEAVVEFLEKNADADALTMVHCETPGGLLNPVAPICKAAKKLGMMTIVDTVASLAGVEFKPKEWGVDISISASQKCIGAPPSLALLAISPEAWERIDSKKQPIRNSYLSLLDWRDSWLSSRRFPFTPFTNEIYALGAALDEILEEGLEARFKRTAEAGKQCRDGVKDLGLQLWPVQEKDCSPTVTAFRVPTGKTDTEIIAALVSKHGILISGGFGDLKGKVLRIGTMGYEAQKSFVKRTIDSLSGVLKNPNEKRIDS